MTFAQFLSILRARKWVALTVFVLLVAITVIVSLILPKQYTGTASVVIDVKPDPVTAVSFPAIAIPGFMATQVDILSSDRVTLRVINDLKLAENPSIRQQWNDETGGEGTVEQWLITLLQKKLDIKPSRDSNVIQISYTAPDPKFAALLANAFAHAYIATTLDLQVNPAKSFRTFFDVQSKASREALERAQARLSEYQQRKGIIATDERLDVENARLNELVNQLVQIQAITAESVSRQAQAQGSQSDRIQEVLNSPLISGLKSDLARSEAKLEELTARYGDAYPQVIETRANVAELRRRIDIETARITGGVAVTTTINRQREVQVRRELEAQRAKVAHMKASRDEGLPLLRDVDNAQRAYDALMARLNQSALESQTTQSFAHLLTGALPPVEVSSPKIALNTALAVFLGLLLAIAVVLALEMTDRRVRKPEDVVLTLGIPVIGVLPKPGAKRFQTGKSALSMQQRVLGLPAPAAGRGA
jgi:succinoglycan biosynthesis transport protein ExoP